MSAWPSPLKSRTAPIVSALRRTVRVVNGADTPPTVSIVVVGVSNPAEAVWRT